MHAYLRAAGFSELRRKKDITRLLDRVQAAPDRTCVVQLPSGETRMQLYAECGTDIGLCVCGECNENDEMEREFYFPFLTPKMVSTTAPCQVQRHAEKESYAGMCEEYKLGVSLIFYVQNISDYLSEKTDKTRSSRISSVMLSGFSVSGKILLPIKKTEKQKEKLKVASRTRTNLLEEARKGNPEAMDTLALEDMDLYNAITGRMRKEDIYSIVDSTFMPFGVECDQYTVIGEIQEVELVENVWTGEEIYVMTVEGSDLLMRIGINRQDLLGEPEVGRRFKGQVWLQGVLQFE